MRPARVLCVQMCSGHFVRYARPFPLNRERVLITPDLIQGSCFRSPPLLNPAHIRRFTHTHAWHTHIAAQACQNEICRTAPLLSPPTLDICSLFPLPLLLLSALSFKHTQHRPPWPPMGARMRWPMSRSRRPCPPRLTRARTGGGTACRCRRRPRDS